ncbi:glyoxalase [Chryseobacterium sp. Leaf180]|uniref:VOC family protein n=1 Tax=Chryseobacterium sp. Leaf180 TaxID=1736289 RepID=UPI0006F673DC|nr:VOC family protein [Chryseobacterium sp. Leaf180]KQR94457.1 glyoxalase [Chryseobacterium sp. Leaf180]
MKPKKIWANLTVADLKRTAAFYTALNFKQNTGMPEPADLVSFSFGDDEFVINFFQKEKFEANTSLKMSDGKSGIEVLFTISAESRGEVDEWAEEAKAAGADIISEPLGFGNGFYGFTFADPDGHAYNVFYM